MSSKRICVQKFLPVHSEELSQIHQASSTEIHNRLAAAFYSRKVWPDKTTIYVTFTNSNPIIPRTPLSSMNTINGPIDPLQQYFFDNPSTSLTKGVEKIVSERLQPLINLKFVWGPPPEGDNNHIIVSFDPDGGSWSLVGTDCTHNDKGKPTMNMGWFDVATVMHEFGHALGLVHEHQNPYGETIKWDEKAVYEWALQTQGWDKETTQINILNKYSNDQINGSRFDPLSIMEYFFPASLTTNGKGTNQNLRLSGDDVLWLANTYKGGAMTAQEYYSTIYKSSLDSAIDRSVKMVKGKGSAGSMVKGKGSGGSMGWEFWVVVVGVVIILALVVALVVLKIRMRKHVVN